MFEAKYTDLGTWSEYVVEKNVLFYINDENKKVNTAIPLNVIANAEIRRLPFVPKVGEKYWSIESRDNVCEYVFRCDSYDVSQLELGLCYRTKEQAKREGIPKMKALIEKWGGKVE